MGYYLDLRPVDSGSITVEELKQRFLSRNEMCWQVKLSESDIECEARERFGRHNRGAQKHSVVPEISESIARVQDEYARSIFFPGGHIMLEKQPSNQRWAQCRLSLDNEEQDWLDLLTIAEQIGAAVFDREQLVTRENLSERPACALRDCFPSQRAGAERASARKPGFEA